MKITSFLHHPLFTPKALVSYFIGFMIGSLMAQILPTLSVYLVDRFNSTAFELGVFFMALAASSIVTSQVVGRFSDKGYSRPKLIFLSALAGAGACILFALSTSYWMALATGVTLFSLATIAFPQIMAHTREYANKEVPSAQIALFNSILRASFALAWIAGPPLGFQLQHWLGNSWHYGLLALSYTLVGLIALWFLPTLEPLPKKDITQAVTIPRNLKLGVVAMALLFGVNHSYLIGLPQLIQTQLGLSPAYTGYVMGLAAGLEIPVMLLGGWLGSRMALIPLIRVGALSAMLLYLGVWASNALWQLFALQIFNAVFVGMVAGLGATWFQDQMPKHTGYASSLFVNAINLGNILGGLIIGIFAAWLGYRHLFIVNALVASMALAVLFLCHYGLSTKDNHPKGESLV